MDRRRLLCRSSHLPARRSRVPGIHAKIPLAIRVDGDDPIPYDTPPTQRALLQAATTEEPK
jgi:hypothetical protein